MKIPVLIETTPDHRYRAAGAEPFAEAVEADTPDAALAQMRKLIDDRIAQGALVAELELPEGANPWLDGLGCSGTILSSTIGKRRSPTAAEKRTAAPIDHEAVRPRY